MNKSFKIHNGYKNMLLVSALGFFASTSSINAHDNQHTDSSNSQKWGAKLELNAKAGIKRHIGSVSAFAPIVQGSNQMVFVHLNFTADSRKSTEGNFGLGYRFLDKEHSIIWGAYGYYDRKETKQGNKFNQATAGLEVLTETWEGRSNIYIPQKTKKINEKNTPTTPVFKGHNLVNNVSAEIALSGFDAEIGRSIPGLSQLRVFAGGYFFKGREGAKSVNGFQARANYKINEYISVETSVSNDKVRKTNAYGGVSFTLKLGGKQSNSLTAIEKRMEDLPIRDVDIVTGTTSVEQVVSGNHQHIIVKAEKQKIDSIEENSEEDEGTISDEANIANEENESQAKKSDHNEEDSSHKKDNIEIVSNPEEETKPLLDDDDNSSSSNSSNESKSSFDKSKYEIKPATASVEDGTIENPYIFGSKKYDEYIKSITNADSNDVKIHLHSTDGSRYTFSSVEQVKGLKVVLKDFYGAANQNKIAGQSNEEIFKILKNAMLSSYSFDEKNKTLDLNQYKIFEDFIIGEKKRAFEQGLGTDEKIAGIIKNLQNQKLPNGQTMYDLLYSVDFITEFNDEEKTFIHSMNELKLSPSNAKRIGKMFRKILLKSSDKNDEFYINNLHRRLEESIDFSKQRGVNQEQVVSNLCSQYINSIVNAITQEETTNENIDNIERSIPESVIRSSHFLNKSASTHNNQNTQRSSNIENISKLLNKKRNYVDNNFNQDERSFSQKDDNIDKAI